MAAYTLAQAINANGRSRSALIRAIRSGKLSASRDASGAYLVDPAELARVYPAGSPADTPLGEDRHAVMATRLAAEEARNAVLTDTVDDLRRRLDTATAQLGEALSQMRALTDQRPSAPAPRWWPLWRRA